jgi:hypothetical protein
LFAQAYQRANGIELAFCIVGIMLFQSMLEQKIKEIIFSVIM